MKAFLKGFVYAIRGVGLASNGRNMRFHLLAALTVVIAGLFLGVSTIQWLIITFCIVAVLSAEVVNTAIEETCNLVDDVANLGNDIRIRNIKDLAAGAVLITATGSAIVGIVIFAPLIF